MDRKVALVLGGSGGIGREVVKSMLNRDIDVCSIYYTKKDIAESVQEVNKGKFSLYQMDLSDRLSVDSAFEQIRKRYKQIDIVVFSVTLPIENKHILNMAWEDFKRHIDLQTKGLFNVIQNLKEQIKTKHKTKFIIVLTEYCIGKPPSGLADYVTAKYSLMGLAKSMVVEFAKHNCTVNMISPGMVDTDLISKLPPKLVEITAQSNPLKRIATPKDVAEAVLFLSSDSSDYLNGANITVNGGGVML